MSASKPLNSKQLLLLELLDKRTEPAYVADLAAELREAHKNDKSVPALGAHVIRAELESLMRRHNAPVKRHSEGRVVQQSFIISDAGRERLHNETAQAQQPKSNGVKNSPVLLANDPSIAQLAILKIIVNHPEGVALKDIHRQLDKEITAGTLGTHLKQILGKELITKVQIGVYKATFTGKQKVRHADETETLLS